MQSTVQLPQRNLNTIIEDYRESLRQTTEGAVKNLTHRTIDRVEFSTQRSASIDFIPTISPDSASAEADQFGNHALLFREGQPQNSIYSQTSVWLVMEKKNADFFLQLSKQTIYPNHPTSLPRLFNKKSLTAYGIEIGLRW